MNNKDKYGEVFTPPFFIEDMIQDCISHMDIQLASNITVFEPGAGKGVFFDTFQNKHKLFGNNFNYVMNEVNSEHLPHLQAISKHYVKNVEIIIQDLLSLQQEQCQFQFNSADLVIGNLPFNSYSKKFVPSLALNNKDNAEVTKSKSVTLWNKMVHFCFQHILRPGGYFVAIIPCIWLKKDKGGIYSLFTEEHQIILLKVFDCQTANKIFKYNCQTPICYVLVKKKETVPCEHPLPLPQTFKLYDKDKYIDFTLTPGLCIPTNKSSDFVKHMSYLKDSGCSSCFSHLRKISTLKPTCLQGKIHDFPKGLLETFIDMNGNMDGNMDGNKYKIITGSSYNKHSDILTLNGFVSTDHALYYGKPKLILPHKRRAKFFKDYSGEYSCFGRDMYVFLCESKQQIDLLYDFFNDPIVNAMIEDGFTVRMNFIEKYVFQYIPWIFDNHFDFECYKNICQLDC